MQGRILILMREGGLASRLRMSLQEMGYEVAGTCATVEDAVRCVGELKPAIVLAGLLEENKDNTALIEALAVPVVFLLDRSNASGSPYGNRDILSPVVEFPFDRIQLEHVIKTILSGVDRRLASGSNAAWLIGVLNSIDDGIIVMDTESIIQFINPEAQKLTGWDWIEAVGNNLSAVFKYIDEDNETLLEIGVVRGGHNRKPAAMYETLLKSRDGTVLPIEVSVYMITREEAALEAVVLVFRDISRRREAINEIQHQSKRAQTLAQSASKLNAVLDIDHVLSTICDLINQSMNASATALFLYDRMQDLYLQVSSISKPGLPAMQTGSVEFPSQTLGTRLTQQERIKIHDRFSDVGDPFFEKLMWMPGATTLVLAGIFRHERLIGFLSILFMKPSDFEAGDLDLIQGIADQAAISIANANLFDQVRRGRQRQHALAQSLVTIQEDERRYIARELHDHLGQSLTGLQFMLERVKNDQGDVKSPVFEEMQLLVVDLIDQVREMSHKLRPSLLDDLGLIPTLHWHVDRYTRQTGILVRLQCDELTGRFSTEIETTAYRIVQEALTNVARYARVSEANVGITVDGDKLWIEVTDNGVGFDLELIRQKPSSGLGGMRERVDLVGGKLLIRSYLGQGTQVLASLPLTGKRLERRKNERQDHTG